MGTYHPGLSSNHNSVRYVMHFSTVIVLCYCHSVGMWIWKYFLPASTPKILVLVSRFMVCRSLCIHNDFVHMFIALRLKTIPIQKSLACHLVWAELPQGISMVRNKRNIRAMLHVPHCFFSLFDPVSGTKAISVSMQNQISCEESKSPIE